MPCLDIPLKEEVPSKMLVLVVTTTYEYVHWLIYSLLEPFQIGEWIFSM
jgi:hypothetical protein